MNQTKAAFLKAASLKTKLVTLPSGEITVTELDAKGRTVVLDLLSNVVELQKKGQAKSNHYASLTLAVVVYGLREDDGSYMFDISKDEDREAILDLSDEVLRTIHREICLLSGLEILLGEKK